jgi:hypothetical protein
LSSWNKRPLRIFLPARRVRMMTTEKAVHHQLKSRVGQFPRRLRGSGGAVFHSPMLFYDKAHRLRRGVSAQGRPVRIERGRASRDCTKKPRRRTRIPSRDAWTVASLSPGFYRHSPRASWSIDGYDCRLSRSIDGEKSSIGFSRKMWIKAKRTLPRDGRTSAQA